MNNNSNNASNKISITDAIALAQKLASVELGTNNEKNKTLNLFDVSELENNDHSAFSLSKQSYINPNEESLKIIKEKVSDALEMGMGECTWDIGVEDETILDMIEEEFELYLKTLSQIAYSLNSDCTLLHKRTSAKPDTTISVADMTNSNNSNDATSNEQIKQVSQQCFQTLSSPHFFGHALIRRKPGQVESIVELRVAVVGNVDAGKSTMLGVLTKDVLDDGRGKARVNLFRHKHEIESGRTSSVGMEIMGFDSKGDVVTPSRLNKPKLAWEDICHISSKILTFIDLAGHEKYLKTTVFGMTGCAPDFVMLMIAANNGIIGMTKEHLGLALALQVPVFVVITKIDMCPANVLESTINHLKKILKSSGCRKMPMFINNIEDVIVTADNFVSERICPIFQVSNVTGYNLDLLRLFLNILKANGNGKYNIKSPVEYQITDTFSVPGVGTVVSGTVLSGTVHAGDSLCLGPDTNGQFTSTVVKSIQRKRVNVPVACAGQNASFALKKIKRAQLRKGMIMLSKSLNPRATYDFEAEVLVLFHSTTISPRYQSMVHCGCVRQTAKIVNMNKQVLRTGDRAIVHFRFMRHPEYLKEGARLLFREGRTKGIGKVVRLLFDEDEENDLTVETKPNVEIKSPLKTVPNIALNSSGITTGSSK